MATGRRCRAAGRRERVAPPRVPSSSSTNAARRDPSCHAAARQRAATWLIATPRRTPRLDTQASHAASAANTPVSGSAMASPTKPVRPVTLRNAALIPPATPQSSPKPTQPAASPAAPCAVMLILQTRPGAERTRISPALIPSCASARGLAASMTMSDAAISESNAWRSLRSARSMPTRVLP